MTCHGIFLKIYECQHKRIVQSNALLCNFYQYSNDKKMFQGLLYSSTDTNDLVGQSTSSILQSHFHFLGPPKPGSSRIQREESSGTWGRRLQGLIKILLDCPVSGPLWCAIFGAAASILIFGSSLEAWLSCWVSTNFLHNPIHRKGSDCITTTKMALRSWQGFCSEAHYIAATQRAPSVTSG